MFMLKKWIANIVKKIKIYAEEAGDLTERSKKLESLNRSEGTVRPEITNKPSSPQNDLPWPDLTPMKTNYSQVMPLRERMLPVTLYEFSKDQAYRFNDASPEFVVVSVLVCASALIGNSCNICPKENDKKWSITQALWGMNIANPSLLKSPTTKVGGNLLDYAHRKVIKPNNLKRAAEAKIMSQKADGLQSQAENDLENSQTDDSEKLFIESEQLKSKIPLQRNVIVNDVTPEALLQHLESNPNGCLIVRDEIYGWLANQERSDNTKERALYTEAFEGCNDFVQKRVSRDTVEIDAMHVGVLGCIQPDRLKPLLSGRESGGSNDGFFERFQLAIFSEAKMQYTDSTTDKDLQEKMQHIFCCLASLKEHEISMTANFSPSAQKIWN